MELLKKIYNKQFEMMVTPCLVDGEPYATRSRKLASIFLSMMCFNGIIGVPVEIATVLEEYNVGSIVMIITTFHLAVTMSIIPYVYLRKTKVLSQGMVDFQVWSAIPSLVSMTLFGPQLSTSMASAILALVSVVLRARGWVLFVGLILCFNIFYILRQDFPDEVPQLQVPIFTRKMFTYEKATAGFGNYLCTVVFFAIGLHKIIQEFVQRSEEADAAIQMNLAVADKLRLYDTDGVAEILAAHEGKVDVKLLRAFTAIQHNLQEYRPHIPDYVISATIAESSLSDSEHTTDVDCAGDVDDDEGAVSKTCSSAGSDGEVLRTSSLFASEKSGSPIRRVLSASSPHRISPTQSMYSLGSASSTVTTASNAGDHHHRHASGKKGSATGKTPGPNNTTTNTARHASFQGKATTVFVRFIIANGAEEDRFGAVARKSGDLSMAVLNKCIDSATRQAKMHGGALQYMQGGGLMVSFNAATRVGSHESKACTFAVGLREDVAGITVPGRRGRSAAGVSMQASVVTSNVHSFFAGTSGQLMLTVLGDYMPLHLAMHGYLSQTLNARNRTSSSPSSCVICLADTAQSVETRVVLRPIGALEVGSSAKSTTIHEVTATRGENPNDEWMYQLAHQADNDPHSNTKAALALAFSGKYQEALALLGDTVLGSSSQLTGLGRSRQHPASPLTTTAAIPTTQLNTIDDDAIDERSGDGNSIAAGRVLSRAGSVSGPLGSTSLNGSLLHGSQHQQHADDVLEQCIRKRLNACIDKRDMEFSFLAPPPVVMW